MSPCKLWQRAVGSRGYGVVYDKKAKRLVYAHRAAWETERGPLQQGVSVVHDCGTRLCVNVEHLRTLPRSIQAAVAGASRGSK